VIDAHPVAATVTWAADRIAAAARDPQASIRGATLTAALRAGIPPGGLIGQPAMERRRVYRALSPTTVC
jgi:hypothetical protein